MPSLRGRLELPRCQIPRTSLRTCLSVLHNRCTRPFPRILRTVLSPRVFVIPLSCVWRQYRRWGGEICSDGHDSGSCWGSFDVETPGGVDEQSGWTLGTTAAASTVSHHPRALLVREHRFAFLMEELIGSGFQTSGGDGCQLASWRCMILWRSSHSPCGE